METITIQLKRIFDVDRGYYGRSAAKCTTFGFEHDNGRIFSVVVYGWPNLPEGEKLTALLDNKDDWTTLAGWVNNSTGEILIAKAPASFFTVYVTILIFFIWICFLLNHIWLFKIQKTNMFPLLFGTIICGVIILYMYRKAVKYKRSNVALFEIQKQVHSRSTF
ncbi:MAG: hypothetical protein V4525_06925 [Pseudomonadota bacterium]